MIQLYALAQALSVLLGLLVGSFLNVCIARMPEDRSVVHPPSHCPACGHNIRPYDNIPVLSWLWLRGQCRDCSSKISVLYPLIELVVGALFWLLFRRFVPDVFALNAPSLVTFGLAAIFVSMLVAMTFVDIRHYIIPDQLSIYAVPVGVLGVVLVAQLGGGHLALASGWRDSVLGAFIGGGSLGLIMVGYWVVRREEGMGMGDVKLLMMMGAFLGPLPAIPFILVVSSLAGACVGLPMAFLGKKGLRVAMPFGPFLAFAGILYVLHGPEIVAMYFPGLSFLLQ